MSLVFESSTEAADPARQLELRLRQQWETAPASGQYKSTVTKETWEAKTTAIIVCDSWDLHHSVNAVRRLEEFAPRLNQVLIEARRRGVTIIHSPSDCMEAYADHPARRRAMQAPKAPKAPANVDQWCLRIPSEEQAAYPVDQSDGGEDDDPQEHAKWVEHLKSLGRPPGNPWKKQTDMLPIDAERDYISSLGDEVWNVLEDRGIKNVILTGVHLNMCVLGRPFGLRQMARGGKKVALMRDMTDTMYNPARWPYVDHFTGTDRVIAHVERYVCPTITSDQLIGGQPFRFKKDSRAATSDAVTAPASSGSGVISRDEYERRWVNISVPGPLSETSGGTLSGYEGPGWYRCVVRFPVEWSQGGPLEVDLPRGAEIAQIWLNGRALEPYPDAMRRVYRIQPESITFGTGNWVVIRIKSGKGLLYAPTVGPRRGAGAPEVLKLEGRWQFRIDDNPAHSNPPLPAQFGGASDVVFQRADARLGP